MDLPEQSKAYGLVREALDRRAFQRAVKICDLVLDSNVYETANTTPYLLARSTAFSKGGKLEDALRDAKAAIKSKPDDPKCYIRAAYALHASGYSAKALSCLSIARVKCSTSNPSHDSLLSRIETLTSDINRESSSGLNLANTSKFIKKSAIQDPYTRLPPEIFIKILRILDQSSRVLATEVSKEWRSFAFRSPILWQELEITKSKWNLSISSFDRILNYSTGTLKSITLNIPGKSLTTGIVNSVGRFRKTLVTFSIELRSRECSRPEILYELARTLKECSRLRNVRLHNRTSDPTQICCVDVLLPGAKFGTLSVLSLKKLGSRNPDRVMLHNHFTELREYCLADWQSPHSLNALVLLMDINKKTIEKIETEFNPRAMNAEDQILELGSDLELPLLKELKLEAVGASVARLEQLSGFTLEHLFSKLLLPALSSLHLSFGPYMTELSRFFSNISKNAPSVRSFKFHFEELASEIHQESEVIVSMRDALQRWNQLEEFHFSGGGCVVQTKAILALMNNSNYPEEVPACPRLRTLHLSTLAYEPVGEVIGEAVKLVVSRLKAAGTAGKKAISGASEPHYKSTDADAINSGGAFSRGNSGSSVNIRSDRDLTPSAAAVSSKAIRSSSAQTPNTAAISGNGAKADSPTLNNLPTSLATLHLPQVDFQSIDQKALDWLRSKLETVTFSPPPQLKPQAAKATAHRNTRGERVWSGRS